MSNLLVIDYDFFFPELDPRKDEHGLWDWAHSESILNIEVLWGTRATGFVRHGLDLPGTSGEEVGFWDRFTFSPDARLFAAESNACGANVALSELLPVPEEVWLYDAHHDSGYRKDMTLDDVNRVIEQGSYSCEDWMILWRALGAELHHRYPTWKDYAFDFEPEPAIEVDRQFDSSSNGPDCEFDAVFVCRSGAWVPSWLDKQFFQFLADAPFGSYEDLMADRYPLKERPWDMAQVQMQADDIDRFLRQNA